MAAIDEQKRVWVGSHAEYGKLHGGLARFDTVSEQPENNPVVIPHQSIASLASEPAGKVVYGASDITGGSGVDPLAKSSSWHGTPMMSWPKAVEDQSFGDL